MPYSRPLALAGFLLLAACSTRQDPPCETGPLRLENASAQVVEQLYLSPVEGGTSDDLLGQGTLATGAALPLPRPAVPGRFGLRLVWANGRAAEIGGLDACRVTRITVQDGSITAR